MTHDKLISLVKDEDSNEISALIEKDSNVIFKIIDFFDDEDFKIRKNAMMVLSGGIYCIDFDFYFQEIEHLIIPRILNLFKDPFASVRAEAVSLIFGLSDISFYNENVENEPGLLDKMMPQILKISYELLEEDSLDVQRTAAFSLGTAAFWFLNTKKDYKKALEIRSKLAHNKDKIIRNHAINFNRNLRNKFPEEVKKMEPVLKEIAENTVKSLYMDLDMSKDPIQWYKSGMEIIDKKKFFKALNLIQKKLKVHPKHKDVWYELGKIYDELGDKQKATEVYKKILRIDPKNPIATLFFLISSRS